jgi:DNA-binding NarL/FixJ family response regulator
VADVSESGRWTRERRLVTITAVQQLQVLLVDDDEDIRFLERNLFEHDGRFDVVGEARNGVEAVQLSRTLQPAAVLLDVLMPEMDGWEALPLIQRVSPATAVVVVSALGRESKFNDRAVWLGASAYIPKTDLADSPDLVAAACMK